MLLLMILGFQEPAALTLIPPGAQARISNAAVLATHEAIPHPCHRHRLGQLRC